MSLFVQTNTTSLTAQTNFTKTELALSKTMTELSSGYKINSAADDAAGLGIASKLTAQVADYTAATQNANTAISMTQTADGGAAQISDILTRLSQLAIEGSSGTMSAGDSANLEQEFASQITEIDNISANTTYNGTSLLSGPSANTTFQVGVINSGSDQVVVPFGGADSANLVAGGALAAATVATPGGALAAIATITTAIQNLSSVRAGFGAALDALQDTVTDLQSMATNTAAALSTIQDVDVASATATMAQQQVMAQAGESILAQANQMPQLAVNLIHGQ